MKMWLKLGILSLSLIAMAATIYTQTVNADVHKNVSVEIKAWNQNDCTRDNYNLWSFIAKTSAQSMTATWKLLKCTLVTSWAWNLDISLTSDLTGVNWTIPKWNIYLSAPARTVTGTLGTWAANAVAAISNHSMSTNPTFYKKDANKVWEVSAIVTLSGTIPAWTAIGTYTTQINVSVP